VLDGSEKLFAIDGQHRVVGIREAVKESRKIEDDEESRKIEDDEVSAIFVAHRNDCEGLERTRRLFTTLNRYAKPVSKQEIIALDEDDVVAIVTRHLVEEHPLFRDKVSLAKGKNIPVSDKSNFTTIIALYDALDIFLKKDRSWTDFKKSRPDDGKIKDFYDKSRSFWDLMTEYFEPLKKMSNSKAGSDVASKYRHKDGGHLLFRPVGLLIVVRVIRHFIDSGLSLDSAVQRIARVPMDLNSNPWVGLLWDSTNKRMITAIENQKAGVKLLFYATGGELSRIGTNPEKLRKELAGIQNIELSKINLQTYA
jgi:DNA sulfur modification protein DndB